jgi:prolyl oligopeptidase PreP (S9A serine peptidase family)
MVFSRATNFISAIGHTCRHGAVFTGSSWLNSLESTQMYLVSILTTCVISLAAVATAEEAKNKTTLNYPETHRVDQSDEFFGVKVPDPYSFHRLGTKQADDKVVYRRPDHPDWTFNVATTDDGKYLVLHISRSNDPQNQVFVRDASAPVDAPFNELIGDFKNQFDFIGNERNKFFFLTDLDAPTKRIITMDIEQPGREHAAAVVAARKATLDEVNMLSGRLICTYLVDVLSQVEVFDLAGKSLGKVELVRARPGALTAIRPTKRRFFPSPATTGHAAFIATMFSPAQSN